MSTGPFRCLQGRSDVYRAVQMSTGPFRCHQDWTIQGKVQELIQEGDVKIDIISGQKTKYSLVVIILDIIYHFGQ